MAMRPWISRQYLSNFSVMLAVIACITGSDEVAHILIFCLSSQILRKKTFAVT